MISFERLFEQGGSEKKASPERVRARRLKELVAEEAAKLKRHLRERGLSDEAIASGMDDLREQARRRAKERLEGELETAPGTLIGAQEAAIKERARASQTGRVDEEAIVIGGSNTETEELLREEQEKKAGDPYVRKSTDETAEEFLRQLGK